MDSSTHLLTQWLADESGVTAIEYGLLAALIAVAIIGGIGPGIGQQERGSERSEPRAR